MNKQDRDRLRELAEKATPGPWLYHSMGVISQNPLRVVLLSNEPRKEQTKYDVMFISESNPQTILSLLDYVDELEKRIFDCSKQILEMGAAKFWEEEVLPVLKDDKSST